MPCFYVYAPLYKKNSNGIRILYKLSESIRQLGYSSKVVCYEKDTVDSESLIPAVYKDHIVNIFDCQFQINEQDIVVYPDIIPDNPLKAKNIVRYLLNRPIYLSGEAIQYQDKDYLVAYSLRVDPNLPQLFILNDDREYFYPLDFHKKDSLVCIYYGKVIDPEIRNPELQALIDTFERKIVITREFPKTRSELGKLLRKSRLLVSLDPISNITYEATLCGTPSLIVDDIFGFSIQKFNINLYGVFSSPALYDEALKDTGLAFSQYEKVLQEHEKNISDFINYITEHFEAVDIKTDRFQTNIYAQVIARRNNSQREIDELRYLVHLNSRGFSNIKLTNIDYLSPTGRKLKQILVTLGANRFFARWYIHIKKWIQNRETLVRLFYRI